MATGKEGISKAMDRSQISRKKTEKPSSCSRLWLAMAMGEDEISEVWTELKY